MKKYSPPLLGMAPLPSSETIHCLYLVGGGWPANKGCGTKGNQEIKKGITGENRINYQVLLREDVHAPSPICGEDAWGLDLRERQKKVVIGESGGWGGGGGGRLS